MSTPTRVCRTPVAAVPMTFTGWSDLELCEALYWLRRYRRSGEYAKAGRWSARIDALLDWRLEHGPDVPLPAAA